MFPTRCFPARLHISDITGAFGNLAVHGQQDSRCVGCRDSSLSADESSASAKDVDIRAPDDFLWIWCEGLEGEQGGRWSILSSPEHLDRNQCVSPCRSQNMLYNCSFFSIKPSFSQTKGASEWRAHITHFFLEAIKNGLVTLKKKRFEEGEIWFPQSV